MPPDHTRQFPDISPDAAEGDRVIDERSASRRQLPNQHDLDADDDQVLWAESAAPWADFDDLEDAVHPHPPSGEDDHPGASSA